MNFSELSNLDIIAIAAVFGLILCVWLIGIVAWMLKRGKRSEKLEQRLGLREGPITDDPGARVLRLWHDGREVEINAPDAMENGGLFLRMAVTCKQAGWSAPFPILLFSALGMAVVAGMIATLLSGIMAGIACGGALPLVLWTFTKIKADKRAAQFDNQFVEALGLCSRSLRAGHPMLAAFKLIADEMPSPVRDIFAQIVQKQSMGVSLEEALNDAAEKSISSDFKLFATCVSIQLRAGGNLADMMDRLADVVRDRLRLGRRVRVLTAQTQFSKRVLIALPFIVFAILNLLNAEYMRPIYTDPLGRIMLGIAALSLFIGAWLMNRMSVLKY